MRGHKNYKNALDVLGIETLDARRKLLSLRFAKTSIEDGILNDLFPKISKNHQMKTRSRDLFKVNHANTKRLKDSPVITMQRMLNEDNKEQT